MTQKVVRVRDLKSYESIIDNVVQNVPFLYCRECGGEYSAHAGDYFAAAPDTVMTCCGEPMVLVRRETRLVEVSQ